MNARELKTPTNTCAVRLIEKFIQRADDFRISRDKGFLTVAEIAQIFGVYKTTVHLWIGSHGLRMVRPKQYQRDAILIEVDEIISWAVCKRPSLLGADVNEARKIRRCAYGFRDSRRDLYFVTGTKGASRVRQFGFADVVPIHDAIVANYQIMTDRHPKPKDTPHA